MVGSTVLTGAVAIVLGAGVGVVGVVAVKKTVSPAANTVATQQEQDNTATTKPQTYGSR
jgi:uncharacterized protein HemX